MKTNTLYLLFLLLSLTLNAQGNDSIKKTEKNEVNKNSPKKDKSNDCKSKIININKNDCNCDCYDLVYDFKCKQFSDGNGKIITNLNELKVRYKNGFRFKIININKYLYTASTSYEDIVYTSDIPSIFNILFLGENLDPAFENFSSPKRNIASLINTSTEDKNLIAANDTGELLRLEKELKKSLFDYKSEIDKLSENYLKAFSICLPDVKCCEDLVDKNTFNELNRRRIELSLTSDSYLLKINTTITHLEKEVKLLEESLKTSKNKTEIEKQIKAINTTIGSLTEIKTEIESLNTIFETITEEQLMGLVHFKNNLVSQNFEHITPTIYPNGDKLSLTVSITPNANENMKKWLTMPLSDEQFSLDLRVRKRWQYSFSTGPFLALSEKLRPETYDWEPQPNGNVIQSDPQYKLQSTGREGLPVGIAAFANLGTKLSDFYGLGFSVGAGASIADKTNIAYFAGFTQFFGHDNQFNVTTGISILQIKELKTELYPDVENRLYDNIINLEYNKKFATGFFVSLSYAVFNPSSKAKKVETNQKESNTTVDKSTDNNQEITVEGAKVIKIK